MDTYYTFEYFESGDGWIELEADFTSAEDALVYGKRIIDPGDAWRVKKNTVIHTEEIVMESKRSNQKQAD